LHRLADRGGSGCRRTRRRVVVASLVPVALAGLRWGGRDTEPRRIRAVALAIARRVAVRHLWTGQRQVDRRAEELEHDLPRELHALGLGLDLHARLDAPRARGRQDPGTLDLDDAHPAHVD